MEMVIEIILGVFLGNLLFFILKKQLRQQETELYTSVGKVAIDCSKKLINVFQTEVLTPENNDSSNVQQSSTTKGEISDQTEKPTRKKKSPLSRREQFNDIMKEFSLGGRSV